MTVLDFCGQSGAMQGSCCPRFHVASPVIGVAIGLKAGALGRLCMPDVCRVDLSGWTTEQLGEAYVRLLQATLLDSIRQGERAWLQQEWSRRSTAERLAVLRLQRKLAFDRVEDPLRSLVDQIRGA